MTPEIEAPEAMDRREAVKRVTALLGGMMLVGGDRLVAQAVRRAPSAPARTGDFSAADIAYLDEVADTILPDTSTPGAKAAKVGAFMALMVTDCYTPGDQQVFTSGLALLEEACKAANGGAGFMAATPAQRTALLERFDQEARDYGKGRGPGQPAHWFRMVKELTLLGYFTSEIGVTQAQRYRESPGPFQPCVPYLPHEKAWAAHA